MLEVNPSADKLSFTGKGLISVPQIGPDGIVSEARKVAVAFTNLRVNTGFCVVDGTITTIKDTAVQQQLSQSLPPPVKK